jgi:ABC-type glycerol-3-phosphate transport system substrate-binding protein
MRMRVLALAAVAVAAGAASAPAEGRPPLQVRVSEALVPCVAALAHAGVTGIAFDVAAGGLEPGESVDVLVASDVEVTRAIESGLAVEDSDVDLVRVPWVLRVEPGNPLGLRGLADLASSGEAVAVLDGPAAYEARRRLGEQTVSAERLRPSRRTEELAAARVAVVPLSLALGAEHVVLDDVRPLVARAAVATRAPQPEAARALVAFLASERGRQALASCGE